MFGVVALGGSREPRGLVCRGLQGRWQQPGAGELGARRGTGSPCFLPGAAPASRAGRGVMEEGSEAASIIAGQGEEQPGFAALLSEES